MRNGVDTTALFGTLDAIEARPELARFQFRVSNSWIGGAHNGSTIKDFHGTGGGQDIEEAQPSRVER